MPEVVKDASPATGGSSTRLKQKIPMGCSPYIEAPNLGLNQWGVQKEWTKDQGRQKRSHCDDWNRGIDLHEHHHWSLEVRPLPLWSGVHLSCLKTTNQCHDFHVAGRKQNQYFIHRLLEPPTGVKSLERIPLNDPACTYISLFHLWQRQRHEDHVSK